MGNRAALSVTSLGRETPGRYSPPDTRSEGGASSSGKWKAGGISMRRFIDTCTDRGSRGLSLAVKLLTERPPLSRDEGSDTDTTRFWFPLRISVSEGGGGDSEGGSVVGGGGGRSSSSTLVPSSPCTGGTGEARTLMVWGEGLGVVW